MAIRTPRQPNLDSVTTINEDGSRYFLHPADVSGKWMNRRRVIAVLLLAIYILLPWIPINGIRANLADEELLRHMKEAGCIRVAFGVETGDEELLVKVNKGATRNQIVEAGQKPVGEIDSGVVVRPA